MDPRVTASLAFLFSAVWAVLMIWDAASAGYNPPAAIHGVPTLVIGALITNQLRKGP